MRTEWKNIDLVSTSLRDCFRAVDLDLDGCRTIAIVVAELLENAMKYGCSTGDCAPGFLRLRIDESPERTIVRVENPVDPNSRALEDLSETIAWIRSHGTPEEAFRERLLEIASGKLERSKLGLVRVAFEGNCDLEASVSANGSMLTVTARCNV